ncbi:glycosyltransferase family 2 protein [Pacificibacter marinus]|uniref:glycosyltransferase family 2 protein n=1 Tax=Pacificibacter marinus TaxID=658057 RepID=UPI001C078955|nr:glycosyltransferase family 2 protein [Pacificibacter marinus]MBU2865856.1 glycosyltransferase family 2 protein [Pacificibacter marinus]
MRYTVATKVKNEGAFLLEWVAWQKMLGFDDILVVHNDCDPVFKDMLSCLQASGWITAAEHFPKGGKLAGPSAQNCIKQHPLVKNTDWLFICDVDEYLVIHDGDQTVPSFLDGRHLKEAGFVVQWKSFGTAGKHSWKDRLLHRTFTQAAATKTPANMFYKSFIYKPRRFRKLGAHEPYGFNGDGAWGEGTNVFHRANGTQINFDPNGKPKMRVNPKWISHEGAQLNHYITKWFESFSAKSGTSSLYNRSAKNRYSMNFFERYNRNDGEDTSAVALKHRFQPVYDRLMAVPGLKALHHLNCAHYVKMLNENTGFKTEDDARYTEQLQAAASAAANTD